VEGLEINMKVLVTGSDGYIGTVLVQELLKKGFEVVGLDTGFYRSGWLYNGIKTPPVVISKDTREVTEEDLAGLDAVVHLAELSNDPLGQLDESLTYEINHRSTVNLAKLAKKAGVKRFIYSSSCSIYGASDEISDESSKPNPLTAYAKCKLLNEKSLIRLASKDFTPVILRNATVFGPSPRMRFDLAINSLCGFAYTTGKIKMQSDGTAWRPFVHIKDVANAMISALTAPRELVHKEIFNIGSKNSNFQIKEIAEIISKQMPDCKITRNKKNVDTRNYKVSFEKALNGLPGYDPKRSVQKGVRELLKLFKKVNLDENTFNSRNYIRLSQIKYLRDISSIDEKFYWR